MNKLLCATARDRSLAAAIILMPPVTSRDGARRRLSYKSHSLLPQRRPRWLDLLLLALEGSRRRFDDADAMIRRHE